MLKQYFVEEAWLPQFPGVDVGQRLLSDSGNMISGAGPLHCFQKVPPGVGLSSDQPFAFGER